MALIDVFQHHRLGTVVVRTAAEWDGLCLEHLAREFSNLLGFVPRAAIRDHIDRGDYYLLDVNGQPAAFVMSGGGFKHAYRLVQVAVTEELWLHGLGDRLLQAAMKRALARPFSDMTATVRKNNPACLAFTATGARLTHVTNPPNARKQPLNHYAWTNPTAAKTRPSVL